MEIHVGAEQNNTKGAQTIHNANWQLKPKRNDEGFGVQTDTFFVFVLFFEFFRILLSNVGIEFDRKFLFHASVSVVFWNMFRHERNIIILCCDLTPCFKRRQLLMMMTADDDVDDLAWALFLFWLVVKRDLFIFEIYLFSLIFFANFFLLLSVIVLG